MLTYFIQLQLRYPNLAGANVGTLTYINVAKNTMKKTL